MAVLLRAPSGKAEIYAKEFQRAGVPLVVERGGFYDSSEILDLLSLLQLLDNPLQDVPAIAVLRSPLVGLSLDELAQIRLAAKGVHFWTALNRSAECRVQSARMKQRQKISGNFLERFSRWRQLARQASLSQCLESVLAETHYAEWLLARPRGAQRRANVERFLGLAQKFDQFQRQGLFRFLKFIEAQREAEVEPEVAAVADENAVRLMSIHQSKGLEFPVVAVADLAKPFNTQDLRGEIIFDETVRPVSAHQAAAHGPAVSEPAALARATAPAPRAMGRGIAAALRRHDPRARHADFDRRRHGEKMGIALVETGGDHDSGHCRGEKLRRLAWAVVRAITRASHKGHGQLKANCRICAGGLWTTRN